MSLKSLRLKRELDLKIQRRSELLNLDKDFERRGADLEKSIEEAQTEDDIKLLDEETEKFEQEKAQHEADKTALENEISELEKELEAEEAKEPDTSRSNKKGEVRTMELNVDIRKLPISKRAFDAMPFETRQAMVQRDDVKQFLERLRECGKQKRNITGGELTIPVVFLDLIAENMYRYSKLLNRVRVRNVTGEARQTIAGTVPEAIWTEMCGAINELTFNFNQVTLDGYKVAGFVPVCNSLLEDSDIALASWIVEMLSEAIGYAVDKAILYGKGSASKMPLGIVTRLAQDSAPAGYPANAPEWQDLSETNLIQIDSSLTGVEFWSALTLAAGNTFTKYSRGNQFWAMNSKTYAALKAKMITFTATGEIASAIYGSLPIVTGDVDVLEFIPDNDIIGGYGDLYLYCDRGAMTIEASREVQFIQDNTVYKGKQRADGMPIIPGAFVGINIANTAVTTEVPFAADTANDADLQDLVIGSESLVPSFDADTLSYAVTASSATDAVTATPVQAGAQVAISYNGKNVKNGSTITWQTGGSPVPLIITVTNGNKTKVYTVNVTKS